MSEEAATPDDHDSSRDAEGDSRAFAVAHRIVELLKRIFFSFLPVLLFWQAAGWSLPAALAGGIAVGYALEALGKRLLAEDDDD